MAEASNAMRTSRAQQHPGPCPGNGGLGDHTPLMTGLHSSPWIDTPRAVGQTEVTCLPEQVLMNSRIVLHPVLQAHSDQSAFVKQVNGQNICSKSP